MREIDALRALDVRQCIANMRAAGLTHSAIAARVGASKSVVDKWSAGDRLASTDSRIALLDAHLSICPERHTAAGLLRG